MKQSRRNFFRNASLGAAGIGFAGITTVEGFPPTKEPTAPRQVWIASLTQGQIGGNSVADTVSTAVKEMEKALPFNPDIYCLPEVFHVIGIKGGAPPLEKSAEDGSGNIIAPFQAFAKKHRCYVICPVYTQEQGNFYNAAVVIDRSGEKIGEYRKTRLTTDEIDGGLTPGPLDPPIFKLDFGTIGIQICYDIEWREGWEKLRDKGAEILFWPSAFAAGKKIIAKAWENQYYVVTSTRKGPTRICDITGEELAISGLWSPWGVCAPVNLEKAFIPSWPYSGSFPAIQRKYGRKVRCYSLHEGEFSVVESLSADLKVADIVKEFNLRTYREDIKFAQEKQEKFWT